MLVFITILATVSVKNGINIAYSRTMDVILP